MRTFQRTAFVGKEAEALEFSAGWKDGDHTVWADWSRVEGGVGAAVVWVQRAHTPQPWDPQTTQTRQGPEERSAHPITLGGCRRVGQDRASACAKTRRFSTWNFSPSSKP